MLKFVKSAQAHHVLQYPDSITCASLMLVFLLSEDVFLTIRSANNLGIFWRSEFYMFNKIYPKRTYRTNSIQQLNMKDHTHFQYNPIAVHVNDKMNDIMETLKLPLHILRPLPTENDCTFEDKYKYKCRYILRLKLLAEYADANNIRMVLLGSTGSHCSVNAFRHLISGDAVNAVSSAMPKFVHNKTIFFNPLIYFSPKEISLYHRFNNLESFNYDLRKLQNAKNVDKIIQDFIFKLQ
ncbi:hypothetical protein MXB_2264, partial [Myxobolus squamalis]